MNRIFCLVLGALTAVSLTSNPAATVEPYPNQPVQIIVPYAGGGVDAIARIFADQLSKELGQAAVVVNRPGGGAQLAINAVTSAPRDGYTLLYINSSPFTIRPHLGVPVPDSLKELSPITATAANDLIVAVGRNSPISNLQQLVDTAKSSSSQLRFASGGYASEAHLAGEIIKRESGVSMVHVAYNGAYPGAMDVVGGRVDLIISTPASLMGLISSGDLKPIVSLSSKRLSLLPDLPTVVELGYPKLTASSWQGLFAPAGTPTPILQKLNASARAVFDKKEVVDRLAAIGADVIPGTPEELDRRIKDEDTRYREVIAAAGIKAQ